MRAAHRLDSLPIYVFALLDAKLKSLRDRGVDIIKLDIGSPDGSPAAAIIDALAGSARDPARSAAIVTFKPGSADPATLAATLYQKERVACTGRGGADRPGIRLSPHFFNLESEVDRAVAAIRKYVTA